MKTEKVVLSFIAVLIGILVAGVAFFFYQSTKIIPKDKKTTKIIATSPTPTPQPPIMLSVDTPKDEEVTNKKTIQITGKTLPDATVVISTPVTDDVITPAGNGSFSTTVTLDDGQNIIEISAIAQTGETTTVKRTVTFSTETF